MIVMALVVMATFTSFTPLQQNEGDVLIKWHKVVHDFGATPLKKVVHAEFRFTNISKDPIVITRVIPSCGCTVPKYDELPIIPGKEGIIRTSFDAESSGVFNKKITVLMDVGNYEIFVKGVVVDK